MFTIHVDRQLIFSTAFYDSPDKVLNPQLTLETTNSGSFSFVLSPNHPGQGLIRKKKSIITVEQDGELLFRGRAAETELDAYNQLSVYCEGDKAFLNDSVYAPGELKGKVLDFFNALIANHNSQVDEAKRFTVGIVDVVDADAEMVSASRKETRVYWNTAEMIETSLLAVYGGYLRTRTVGNTHYLDWVKEYGQTSTQPIEFGVNLLDLTNRADAGDVFTVLIPLGYSEIGSDGTYGEPVTIESVNNGLNYIQDDEAVALYGKIWRTQTWQYEQDPAELLAKARKFLATGAELETLTIRAVDMHFVDGNARAIRVGDMVRIHSEPHGVNRTIICSKIDMDLLNPENTTYVFGEVPRVLTDDINDLEEESNRRGGGGGGRKSIEEELSDIIRWADFKVDKNEAQILLTAGELDKTKGDLSEALIAIDGINAQLLLKASTETVEDAVKRISDAEVAIDGANAAIALKASQKDVTALTNRVSAAEIALDGVNATIALKASKEEVTELGKRVSSAEVAIDGANANIALKASKSDMDALGKRVSAAEVSIDGANAAIALKVNKDGVISSINQTPETVTIQASKINLSGYVTASQLEAELADFELTWSDTVATQVLSVSRHAGIASMTYGGSEVYKNSRNVVTEVTFPTHKGTTINYVDANGVSHSQFVVTGFATSSQVSKGTVYYLGY